MDIPPYSGAGIRSSMHIDCVQLRHEVSHTAQRSPGFALHALKLHQPVLNGVVVTNASYQHQRLGWRKADWCSSLRRAVRKPNCAKWSQPVQFCAAATGAGTYGEWGQQVWLNNSTSRCSEPGWLSHLQQGNGAIETPSKSQADTRALISFSVLISELTHLIIF